MPVATALPPTPRAPRPAVARLVGARRDDVVQVLASPAAAFEMLARQLPDGSALVLETSAPGLAARGLAAGGRSVRTVRAAATLAGTVARVDEALAERPAALLAVPGADPVTGELLPIAALADVAHAHGATFAVDAALVAPAGRLDLGAARVDHAVVSAAELSPEDPPALSPGLPAPLAAGALVGRTPAARPGGPHLPGARADPQVEWAVAAAVAAACSELAGLPDGELAAHVAQLRAQLLAGLHTLPGVRVLQLWPDATAHAGVLSLTVQGWSPAALLARLTRRPEPEPALPRLDAAGDGVRVRLHAGTTDAEVEALLEVLEDVATGAWPGGS